MTCSSLHLFPFFSIINVLIFFSSSLSRAQKLQPPASIYFPIKKNDTTLQYYTTFGIGSPRSRATVNALLDLGGPQVWFDCAAYKPSPTYSYRPIACGSPECNAVKGSGCLSCSGSPPKPGCTNNTCAIFAYSKVQNLVVYQEFGEDTMRVHTPNNVAYDSPHFKFSCAELSVLDGLSPRNNINGLAGFGRTKLSLYKQISTSFKLPNKFSLCIPSTPKKGRGYISIGGGQSKSLTTTPLVVNPVGIGPLYFPREPSYEYFIKVNDIQVGGKSVTFNKSLLSINKTSGIGGTKLSTVTPYTVLHSSIYSPMVSRFVETAASRSIKTVTPISPFGACFRAKDVTTITGPGVVPEIDLVLEGVEARLRLYGANSMVKVNKNVTCLAFVDGGVEPTASIVLGGHQLENFLLEFDLANSKLGFSTNSSCSHL